MGSGRAVRVGEAPGLVTRGQPRGDGRGDGSGREGGEGRRAPGLVTRGQVMGQAGKAVSEGRRER